MTLPKPAQLSRKFIVLALAAASCTAGADFTWDVPAGFPRPAVPAGNPMSAAKIELGRRLFYDKRMSVNGKESCGSCHRQELAFTDGKAHAALLRRDALYARLFGDAFTGEPTP